MGQWEWSPWYSTYSSRGGSTCERSDLCKESNDDDDDNNLDDDAHDDDDCYRCIYVNYR